MVTPFYGINCYIVYLSESVIDCNFTSTSMSFPICYNHHKMAALGRMLTKPNIRNVLALSDRKMCEIKSPVKCKIGIVTGGAMGIGYALADALLRCGARGVMIGDILEKEGEEAAKCLCEKYGPKKACFLKTDVTKKEELKNLFQCTKEKYKQLDIVINNAGIMQEKFWEKEIDINVKGTVHGTLLGFEYMGKHNYGAGGTIVNVGSIYGLQNTHACPVYSGTKHFIVRLSDAFSHPYYEKLTGVKVFTLCPGVTDTNLPKIAPTMTMEGFGDLGKVLLDDFAELPIQEANVCCCCMMKMLCQGENGSIFVIENCECYQIELPDGRCLKADK